MADKKVVSTTPPEEQPSSKGSPKAPAKELGGREGPDPVRYGDWENKGIASDF